MRYFLFDKYNTWYDWRLTLTGKDTTDPEPKTNYVDIDGAHGTLDLSEALTGEVVYGDRTVTASFWSSEGSYQDRERVLREMTAQLHGKKVQIIEPDDPGHFFLGRVKIKNRKKDAVHIELTLEATCDPWRYAVEETERRVEVSGDMDLVLHNNGVKTICPVLTVTGSVGVTVNGTTEVLTAGSYQITDLLLRQGVNLVGLSGSGTITFTYREADL